jgi:hypothetical protein
VSHAHRVVCPVPDCGFDEQIEQPIDLLPVLAREASTALHRRVERTMREHAATHEPAEWWAACAHYRLHEDRSIEAALVASHVARLRRGRAVWTVQDEGPLQGTRQIDVRILHVQRNGVIAEFDDGTSTWFTTSDVLEQIAMTQVRPG